MKGNELQKKKHSLALYAGQTLLWDGNPPVVTICGFKVSFFYWKVFFFFARHLSEEKKKLETCFEREDKMDSSHLISSNLGCIGPCMSCPSWFKRWSQTAVRWQRETWTGLPPTVQKNCYIIFKKWSPKHEFPSFLERFLIVQRSPLTYHFLCCKDILLKVIFLSPCYLFSVFCLEGGWSPSTVCWLSMWWFSVDLSALVIYGVTVLLYVSIVGKMQDGNMESNQMKGNQTTSLPLPFPHPNPSPFLPSLWWAV